MDGLRRSGTGSLELGRREQRPDAFCELRQAGGRVAQLSFREAKLATDLVKQVGAECLAGYPGDDLADKESARPPRVDRRAGGIGRIDGTVTQDFLIRQAESTPMSAVTPTEWLRTSRSVLGPQPVPASSGR